MREIRSNKWLALVLTVSIGLVGRAAADAPSAQWQAARLAAANSDYERNSWQAAFGTLAQLADGGHAEAARIALLMVRYGPALYGQEFGVDRVRMASWGDLASRAGMSSAKGAGEPWRYHCTGVGGGFVLIKDGAHEPWTLQPAQERAPLPLNVQGGALPSSAFVAADGQMQGWPSAAGYRCVAARED